MIEMEKRVHEVEGENESLREQLNDTDDNETILKN